MKSEKRGFIFGLIIVIFFICLFTFLTIVMICLSITPSVNTLKKEQCTFISHEVIYYGKRNSQKKCYIYVEEYNQPLVISHEIFEMKFSERLSNLVKGDIITVSIKQEGSKKSLYLIQSDNKQILSYDEYVYNTKESTQIGITFFSIFNLTLITFLIVGIVHYKKTGKNIFNTKVRL